MSGSYGWSWSERVNDPVGERSGDGRRTEILIEWPVAIGQGRAERKAMLKARRGLGEEAIACGQEVRS